MMKKKCIAVIAACMALPVLAGDLVLNLKVSGKELASGDSVGKVKESGFLVIENIEAVSNSHSGFVYFYGLNENRVKTYVGPIPVSVELIDNASVGQSDVGALVFLNDVTLATLGKIKFRGDTLVTVSLRGSFSYPTSGDDPVMGTGTVLLRYNKTLTYAAESTSSSAAIESWLELKKYVLEL